ncbi:T9SS type A sorting domain-containing protein [Chryseobacterium polytrichastri]|uniref:Por secretion system C-terminal sorting domain-containing protein n=1 Tax=Chryseobacterium polytrichastri TaxID=1302687 RepID=A0A1M6XPZ6_9FLAO|nr:T9SS type A sorting domain-containing protein [Chryseobacterium polytrichastri]SHL08072.1 Por secretion system C-terminal sorting domain-containing protein [Chryseobacterium polytrichastri]
MLKITCFGNKLKTVILCLMTIFSSFSMVTAQCSLTGWKKFSQGETFSVGLKEDGTLWVWGQNINGILGNGSGTTTILQYPTQIGTDNNWTDISVGRWFILAKKTDNNLYGWGDNQYGNLGNGNNTNQYSPIMISTNVKSFSAGYHHTMIVKNDGTMWGTGYNQSAALGMGTSVGYYNTWQQESSLATNWEKASSGYYNSFGIKTNGTLWSAGTNVEGQTGTGATGGVSVNFVQIGTDTNWKDVSCGVYHVLGLKTNNKLFGWGYSANGRLGIVGAGAQYFRTPQAVEAASNYSQIATSWDASAILKNDNTIYAFGINHNGITGGAAADTNNLAPQQVGTSNNWKTLALRVGGFHFGAVQNDTTVWAWGANNLYQLGNGDGATAQTSVPTQVVCSTFLATNDIKVNQNKVSIYPNPAKDIINISSQQKLDQIKIYNTSGVLVKSASDLKNKSAISISDLPAGIYLLQINNETQSFKLIKE